MHDRKSTVMLKTAKKNIFFVLVTRLVKFHLKNEHYLKDQHLKKEPKGLYQMASVDRTAIKRLSQTRTQHVKDCSICNCSKNIAIIFH